MVREALVFLFANAHWIGLAILAYLLLVIR